MSVWIIARIILPALTVQSFMTLMFCGYYEEGWQRGDAEVGCLYCWCADACVYVRARGGIYSAYSSETNARWHRSGFRAFLSRELYQMWFVRIKGREKGWSLLLQGGKNTLWSRERHKERSIVKVQDKIMPHHWMYCKWLLLLFPNVKKYIQSSTGFWF